MNYRSIFISVLILFSVVGFVSCSEAIIERRPFIIDLSLEQDTEATYIIEVRNAGSGVLHFTKSTDVSWISGLPISGTSTGEWVESEIIINTSGLASGMHTGTIIITDDFGRLEQVIFVNLKVDMSFRDQVNYILDLLLFIPDTLAGGLFLSVKYLTNSINFVLTYSNVFLVFRDIVFNLPEPILNLFLFSFVVTFVTNVILGLRM